MRFSLPSHQTGWLRRRSARLLAGSTLAITGCLAIAVPAHAATVAAGTVPAAVSGAASATVVQTLDVSHKITAPKIVEETFEAIPPNVSQVLQQTAPQTDSTTLASTASALGVTPGARLKIVSTALSYLGTPYVLGGASKSGIDCSGLTMVAYAAVGVSLAHYVPTQDAAGHVIAQSAAKPGDLVIFNDDAHVGLYLGNGLLVAAPEPGRAVQIEPVSKWSGIGYHFTRILGD